MANRRKRAEFSKRTKIQAWDRCAGFCEACDVELATGKFHFDHVIPTAIKADNALANCRVLCRACHAVKTTLDQKIIARARRIEEKHLGIDKEPRDKPRLLKKITGEVIDRETGEQIWPK